MADETNEATTKRAGKCPICGKPVEAAYRPFCSPRCRDIDLARWLGGGYAIAGGSADADEDGDSSAAGHAAGSGAKPEGGAGGDDAGSDGGGSDGGGGD